MTNSPEQEKAQINPKLLEPAIDNHFFIAKEGWVIIAVGFVAALIFGSFSQILGLIVWLFVIFCLQFFRDPMRKPSGDEWAILAPADGKVIAIEKCEDPIRKVSSLKVSIFMNVFNVHSNRSPINGKVIARKYFQGSFVNADFNKASLENERNALVIRHAVSDTEITCIQVAGLVARRILCYVTPNDNLLRGQRYGFIRFGSRVDLYLPEDIQLRVAIGEHVVAGVDYIGKFIKPESEQKTTPTVM